MNNIDLIKKLADRILDGHDTAWEMNIDHFDWVPGVGLYGIWMVYEATGDKKYLAFLIDWTDRHLGDAKKQLTVNSTAPLLTIQKLIEITKNQEYLSVCMEMSKFTMFDAPKTPQGALEHTVTEKGSSFNNQMWADTMFMSCIFLAELGKRNNDNSCIEFAVKQLRIHYQYLWDEHTNLFYHGWDGNTQSNMSGIHWGRANAWMLYSTLEILAVSSDFEGKEEIIHKFQKTIQKLMNLQRENGMYGTIIDMDVSYDEASATAGIACAMIKAHKAGYVGDEVLSSAMKAVNTLKQLVNENGELTEVSTGTPVMPSAQGYMDIKKAPTLYGQAFMCMLLKELCVND